MTPWMEGHSYFQDDDGLSVEGSVLLSLGLALHHYARMNS